MTVGTVIARREFALGEADALDVALSLEADLAAPEPRGARLYARFTDAAGAPIAPPYPGWKHATDGGAFVLVPVAPRGAGERWSWSFPAAPGAAAVALELVHWRVIDPIGVECFEAALRPRAMFLAHGLAPSLPPPPRSARDERLRNEIFRRYVALSDTPVILEIELTGLGEGDDFGATLLIGHFDAEGAPLPPPPAREAHDRPGFEFAWLSTIPDPGGPPGTARRFAMLAPREGAASAVVAIERRRDRSAWAVGLATAARPAAPAAVAASLAAIAAQAHPAKQGAVGVELLRHLRQIGAIEVERDCLRRVAGCGFGDYVEDRWPRVEAMLRELDPAWLPAAPGPAITRPIGPANRVMMLAKVALPFENSGGAVRNLATARTLRAAGWDPYVVTPPGWPGAAADPALPYATAPDGVPHLHLNIPDAQLARIPVDRIMRWEVALLGAILGRYGARLIHAVSGNRGYDNALKALALRTRFNIPVLYDLRSLHEQAWSAPGPHSADAALTRLRAAQEDRCVREADHTVVISEAMKSLLVGRGAPPERISVIPNGVDAARFADPAPKEVAALRAALGIAPGAPVHGYISNISAREGHGTLIAAHAILHRDRPGLVCLIVGEGPLRARAERQARELGVVPSVVFTGEVPHDRIALYYRLFDVFVVPRVRDYAADHVTPIKPFEAMAAGRAVVMSELPVTREIIGRDGERGALAEPGDPAALALAIAALLDNPDHAAALAERGRAWVAAERGWDRVLARYDEIYRRLGAGAAR